MTNTTPLPALTLVLTAPSEESDPLDTSGENKRLMIAAADRILDAAIARMPEYLFNLPPPSRPSLEQLAKAMRREYRIKGPRIEVDISVRKSHLPESLMASINAYPQKDKSVPTLVIAVSRVTGWVFGVPKKEQDKIIDQVHQETLEKKRETLIHKVGSGLAELLGVALEIEVVNQSSSLTNSPAIRQVSVRRGL
jgi:hypothetical protein